DEEGTRHPSIDDQEAVFFTNFSRLKEILERLCDVSIVGSNGMFISPARINLRTDIVVDVGESINPALDIGQGVGETAVFLGCSALFAIKDAVDSVRAERNLPKIFTLNSPATPEKVRMACEDQLTKM
ncbi:hypothetical protein AB205_0140120, partial [Aquarana catesbeiana]